MKSWFKVIVYIFGFMYLIIHISCGSEDMWSRLQESGTGYRVLYNANGATAGTVPVDKNLYAQDATVTVLGNTGNLARLGYTYNEWNTEPDGSGTNYAESDNLALTGSDLVLYAQWFAIPSYNVTYNANGGSPITSVPVDPTIYQYHQTVTVSGKPADLLRTGFSFIGWNTLSNGAGTNYTQGQTFMMDLNPVTLYANWTNAAVYTVTYSANLSTGGAPPVDTTNYINGATVTVLGNTGNLVRTGYIFNGWNTQSNGLGTNYFTGSQFTISSNVTLYPNWVTGTTYMVTYSSNSADSGTVPVDNTNYLPLDDPPVLANSGNLVRAGYSFVCWNTKSNGTGTDYEPGSVSGSGIIDITSNIILYAKWSFPVMVDENFDDSSIDAMTLAAGGTSYVNDSGNIILTINTSNTAGIKSRLFKIPVIIEGRANIQDSSATGVFEYFCIRQVPDTYSSLNPVFQFGFASGYDYSNIWTDITYWDSETTVAHDAVSAGGAYTEAAYHVFRLEIYNDLQYFYIDNNLVRTTYYGFLSNTWWNFIMLGDSNNTANQQLDWIKIYTARPSDIDPVWP